MLVLAKQANEEQKCILTLQLVEQMKSDMRSKVSVLSEEVAFKNRRKWGGASNNLFTKISLHHFYCGGQMIFGGRLQNLLPVLFVKCAMLKNSHIKDSKISRRKKEKTTENYHWVFEDILAPKNDAIKAIKS